MYLTFFTHLVFPVLLLSSWSHQFIDYNNTNLQWVSQLPLELKQSYQNAIHVDMNQFECLDGSKSIELAYLNDDFCDCLDASDEPRTSACPNGGGFFCDTAYGAHTTIVATSRVHDGICDCCDGSDEEPGVCQNDCDNWRDNFEHTIKEAADKHIKGYDLLKKAMEKTKKFGGGSKLVAGELQYLKRRQQDYAKKAQTLLYTNKLDAYHLHNTLAQHTEREYQVLNNLPSTEFGKRYQFVEMWRHNDTSLTPCYYIMLSERDFKGGSFEPEPLNFTFHYCPFISATQVQERSENDHRDQGNPSLLGLYSGYVSKDHLPSVRAGSAILGNTTGPIQFYTNGDPCWKGPNRVAFVAIECGLTNRLVNVAENGKCSYEMIFETYAACEAKQGRVLLGMLADTDPEREAEEDEEVPRGNVNHDEL